MEPLIEYGPLIYNSFNVLLNGGIPTTWYDDLKKSPLNPPSFVFGPVWTLLYWLQGKSYLFLYNSFSPLKLITLSLALVQMYINSTWFTAFFKEKDPEKALKILDLMIGEQVILTLFSLNTDILATILQIPYISWIVFARHLNQYVVDNNKL